MRFISAAAGLAAGLFLAASPMASAATLHGTFQLGSRGRSVSLLQSRLAQLGYPVGATGYFGPVTLHDVQSFQKAHHLVVDGIVGPVTEHALFAAGHPAAVTKAAFHAVTNPVTVTVQAGDTLASIAGTYHTTWQALARMNHLADPNRLAIGQVLRLPGRAAASGAAVGDAGSSNGSASVSLPTQSASQSLNAAIVATAFKYLGVPYVWGGENPATGFDCSGLVQYVLQQNGITIGRTSYQQYQQVTPVSKADLVPGDLLFFSTDAPGASHVAIYIGSYPKLGYAQAFIDAPAPGQSVMVQNLHNVYWNAHYLGAGAVEP
jgi:peptidoglycan endopeptidase LytE